jgi:hypothetical protein
VQQLKEKLVAAASTVAAAPSPALASQLHGGSKSFKSAGTPEQFFRMSTYQLIQAADSDQSGIITATELAQLLRSYGLMVDSALASSLLARHGKLQKPEQAKKLQKLLQVGRPARSRRSGRLPASHAEPSLKCSRVFVAHSWAAPGLH